MLFCVEPDVEYLSTAEFAFKKLVALSVLFVR